MTLEQLRADVAEQLGEPAAALGDRDNLLDRGLDSMALMTLVERWSENGVEVSFLDLTDEPTLAGWHELLARRTDPTRPGPGGQE